ncbi:hypothetical protein FF021_18845 [Leptospira noguchii]|uniref:hypothetical protein n=1 Tax=Leptospira noguchii TaxID=28182 RepID=UPI0011466BD7|nr:hypothetical protein [Leptospira noguchii]TQE66189.1 hypothetical protein FF021_18845 [Leptospira noguchii]UOG54901.1 hypothetical protein MAL09_20020 [Leptospira noguchii]
MFKKHTNLWSLEVNSASRFYGRSTGRVNSAKRFLRKRFRVNKLKFKSKYRITFLLYNLLTRAESPAGCLWQAGFAPVFLCRTHVR